MQNSVKKFGKKQYSRYNQKCTAFETPINYNNGVSPMTTKGQMLQDPFLNALRKEHVPVSIYLVNGIKLQGQVESFDQYVVLLRNTSVTQMVYKHAISTIVPARAVNLQHESKPQQQAAAPVQVETKPVTE